MRGQSLVELALVMPLLTVVFAVLLQIGIIFMVYLNVIHTTRDLARWLVVHPDNLDATVQAHALANLPDGLFTANMTWDFSSGDVNNHPWAPRCTAFDVNGRCASRPAGTRQQVVLQYDVTPHVLLPTTLGASWWQITVPWQMPRYTYSMMVEPR